MPVRDDPGLAEVATPRSFARFDENTIVAHVPPDITIDTRPASVRVIATVSPAPRGPRAVLASVSSTRSTSVAAVVRCTL